MIWGVPSAIALLIKCVLFFYSDIYKQKYFFIFLLMTFCLNSLELLGFFRLGHDLEVLKLYYCSLIFTAYYLTVVCADISQSAQWLNNQLSLIVVCAFSSLTLFTDHIVSDFNILPNESITKVAGDFYLAFQIYMMATLLLALGLLIRRLIYKEDYLLKVRSIVSLLAFTPYIISTITIITLMQLGYHINVVGLSSLAICFMLFMFIVTKDKHKLFNIMSFIPFSRERIYRIKLKKLLQDLHGPIRGEQVHMKALIKELEALIIDQTKYHFNTQKEVAQMFNISESSLSRKKIDRKAN